jgi:hypothetical protein
MLIPKSLLLIGLAGWLGATVIGCQRSTSGSSGRSYRMGFENSAPKLDYNMYMQSLNLWLVRSDAAIISAQVPWDSLLGGEAASTYVVDNFLGLANLYRSHLLKLWVYIDPENGLNRTADADDLVALGKSIAQPEVQLVYRNFVRVMDSILRPDHLGLALETNLIRAAAPDSIYQGVRQASNAAAQDMRTFDPQVKLSISVQVETAWGVLGQSGPYQGVDQDFADFPFIQELGLSSYPYFSFASPQDIPSNYYSRLVQGRSLPVFVTEGGWTSQTITGFSGQAITSSSAIQASYIRRQSTLLEQALATAVFQLTFTDIDLSSLSTQQAASLKYFAWLGMVDTTLQPKASLSTWDSVFSKILQPGN